MIIKFDRSYISAGTRELIERGYAREELDKLVFRFEYTEEERIQNREMAVKLSSEVGQPPRTGRLGGEAK